MDDDCGQASVWDPEKGWCETIERDDDDDAGEYSSDRCTDTTFRLQRRSRKGTGGWIRVEDRTDCVRYADGDQLLVWIDLVTIHTTESFDIQLVSFSKSH